ncbi:MAG: (2Fe-2S) ferredoxin domain-containing protein [Fibrobacter sp.]|nr:(2Fe-2S) ferredoxin domain-containing protein [Fibrobacter sp.]
MNPERHLAVKVCLGSSCYLRGGREVLEALCAYISENKLGMSVKLSGTLCEGRCSSGPAISIGTQLYTGVKPEDAVEALKKHLQEIS